MGFGYNPLSVISDANKSTKGAIRSVYDKISKRPGEEEEAERKRLLYEQAKAAGTFAGQGESGYGAMTGELAQDRASLRDLASGKNSVSAEQLRQALGQNLAAQRSMAASASPANGPMAARTAAMNMARSSTGLAGQQAIAGLAERNAATNALAQLNLGQRGQDVNVGLGSRGNAITGYSAGKTETGQSTAEKLLGAGAAIAALKFGPKSDRNLKTDIQSGDASANKMLEALKAHTYRYKDEQHGKGQQLGIIAQDLERAGLKQAVINEPDGKAIDGGKLSTANTAMLAALARRMERLEGRDRR